MCVLIFSTSFVWNISHSKKNLARGHKRKRHVKYPLFLLDCIETSIFWTEYVK